MAAIGKGDDELAGMNEQQGGGGLGSTRAAPMAELQTRLQTLVAEGNFTAAIDLLSPIVTRQRNNQSLLHLMADLYARSGNVALAESWFRRAIKCAPGNLAPYLHLAEMFRENGKFVQAEKVLRKAVRIAPESALVHGHLGAVLLELDRLQDALDATQVSIRLDPGNPKVHNNYAVVCHRLGRPDDALSGYHRALKLNPSYLEAQRNLARHWRYMGESQIAEELYQAIVDANPGSFKDAWELAEYYLEQGKTSDAVSLYERFEGSGDANILERLGSTLQEVGHIARGNELLRTALSHNPNSGIAWFHLVLAMDKGDLDIAVDHIHVAFSEEKKEFSRQHLAFALGRAYERLRRPVESFKYLRLGNALRRRGYDYSTAKERQRFSGIKECFTAENAARWTNGGYPDSTPIFVIGMPRSGTTLVEQIISSHPEVFGAGELTILPQLTEKYLQPLGGFPVGMTQITDDVRYAFGQEYVAQLRRYSADARFMTDKMPHNFLRFGIILAIFPHARIIHCRRDPRDNCWSIFKQLFSGYHPYAYDLTELGEYHRMYQDLMSHWRSIYHGELLEIDYERLVNDPEVHVRQILDYCDLEWDERCLRFYEQDRAVHTASKLQVRKPMYRASVAAWESYRNELAPLLRALGNP